MGLLPGGVRWSGESNRSGRGRTRSAAVLVTTRSRSSHAQFGSVGSASQVRDPTGLLTPRHSSASWNPVRRWPVRRPLLDPGVRRGDGMSNARYRISNGQRRFPMRCEQRRFDSGRGIYAAGECAANRAGMSRQAGSSARPRTRSTSDSGISISYPRIAADSDLP